MLIVAIALFVWIVLIPAAVVLVRLRVAYSRLAALRPAESAPAEAAPASAGRMVAPDMLAY